MEHESHFESDSSITSIATKIFGGLIALAAAAGVLYLLYVKSGLDPSFAIASAYDNCKASILSSLARPDLIHIVNTPSDTQVIQYSSGYTLMMQLRINDGRGNMTDSTYRCDVAKTHGFLDSLKQYF